MTQKPTLSSEASSSSSLSSSSLSSPNDAYHSSQPREQQPPQQHHPQQQQQQQQHPWECHLAASALAATINYPLWRASAVGQSGFAVASESFTISLAGGKKMFHVRVPSSLSLFAYAFRPPYKGVVATVMGMTWARAAIFWGSDSGKSALQQRGYNDSIATVVPPLVVSTMVQIINMPLVRATITIQNPACDMTSVPASIVHIYRNHGGISGLWHGTSAGILKSVPKYCTAVIVKDYMDNLLSNYSFLDYYYHHYDHYDSTTTSTTTSSLNNHYYYYHFFQNEKLIKSAIKSTVAGIAGAALTNPLDVIRNEMFKTNLGLIATVRLLYRDLGWRFVSRGLGKNLIAVSVPVACTIFFTDTLIHLQQQQQH